MEQWLKPHIHNNDYRDILEEIWDALVEKDLSFIVKDNNGKSLGVALNFDAHDEPAVDVNNKLILVFELLEFLEGPIRYIFYFKDKITENYMFFFIILGTQNYPKERTKSYIPS